MTTSFVRKLLATLACLTLFCALPAAAGTVTTTFGVSGSVTNSCTSIVVTSPGTATLVPSSSPASSTGTIAFTCTDADALSIALDAGLHGSGNGTASPILYMCDGTCTGTTEEEYQIYQNSGYSTIWGNDPSPSNEFASTGTGSTQTITFYVGYSSVPGTAVAGSYSDTATFTLTY